MKNNKIKIVVDTNVFVNGMIFSENFINDTETLAILLDLIENNKIELVFSQDTIGELMYIMKNKIIHYIKEENRIDFMNQLTTLFFYSYSINTENTIAPKCKDIRDNMFLKCVVGGKAKYLISNDFRSGMHIVKNLNCNIVDAKTFVELYNKTEEQSAFTK